jgi:hypothetical protein
MYTPVYGFPNARDVAILVSILRVINKGAISSADHFFKLLILDI